MSASVIGFVTGLTLIIAIGAQNAFVLRQGIRREHVLPVVIVCSLADAVLISAGAAGLGVLVERYSTVTELIRYGGAAFLLGYAALAARRAMRPGALTPGEQVAGSVRTALLTCLAFTFGNPHVYLDTVVLLGSLAQRQDGPWLFVAGAVTASFTWFFALGYGARKLGRFFASPRSWQVLDGVIAVVMAALAARLLMA